MLPHGHGVTCSLVSLAPEGELKTVEDETETTLEVALFTFILLLYTNWVRNKWFWQEIFSDMFMP